MIPSYGIKNEPEHWLVFIESWTEFDMESGIEEERTNSMVFKHT